MRSHRSHCLMSISAINAVRASQRLSRGAHARQSSRALEVAFFYVRLNPEGRLQDHRFPPGVVHAIDDLRRVAFPREIGLHRNHDRSAESEQVPGANVAEGMPVISLIFFTAMVAQTGLVLIVEPRLIVLGLRGAEYPRAETFPPRRGLAGVDLAGLRFFIMGGQRRVAENDTGPGI